VYTTIRSPGLGLENTISLGCKAVGGAEHSPDAAHGVWVFAPLTEYMLSKSAPCLQRAYHAVALLVPYLRNACSARGVPTQVTGVPETCFSMDAETNSNRVLLGLANCVARLVWLGKLSGLGFGVKLHALLLALPHLLLTRT
jgi:hypothetical protein